MIAGLSSEEVAYLKTLVPCPIEDLPSTKPKTEAPATTPDALPPAPTAAEERKTKPHPPWMRRKSQ